MIAAVLRVVVVWKYGSGMVFRLAESSDAVAAALGLVCDVTREIP
jgi:hypothetical protein